MYLNRELIETFGFIAPENFLTFHISGLVGDRRRIRKHFGFVVFQKEQLKYLPIVVKTGAVAVFTRLEYRLALEEFQTDSIVVLVAKNLELAIGNLYSYLAGSPSSKLNVIGISGSSGKTSLAVIIAECLGRLKQKTACFLNQGNCTTEVNVRADHKRIDSGDIQKFLFTSVKNKIKWVTLESGFEDFENGSCAGMIWNSLVFTNIFDEHSEKYEKLRESILKKLVIQSDKFPGSIKYCIICTDSFNGQKLYRELILTFPSLPVFSIGQTDTDLKIEKITAAQSGYQCNLKFKNENHVLKTKLTGLFNLYNAVCAFLVLKLNGFKTQSILDTLLEVNSVPGRMETVYLDGNRAVYSDIAASPERLERVLKLLYSLNPVRIILVFSSKAKQSPEENILLGRVASLNADFVIITNEYGQATNSSKYFQHIKNGVQNSNYVVIPDRKKAILAALHILKPHEILIITGDSGADTFLDNYKTSEISDKSVVYEHVRDLNWTIKKLKKHRISG